jgi:hypothetical protein
MDVIGTDEFTGWYGALDDASAESVTRAINVLERLGAEQGHVTPVHVYPQIADHVKAAELRLFELSVEGCALRVLFALETPERAILLYGYDADTERRAGAARQIPAAAHVLLAANVYRIYRAGRPGEA